MDETILSRLERVETENRKLKRIGLAVLVLTGAIFLMGQARSSRTLEAERFVLKDAKNRVRAELAMELGNRPTLTLRDEAGYPVAVLGGGNAPFMTLSRMGNAQQIQLSVSGNLQGLAVYDGDTLRTGVGVVDGAPALTLYDKQGKERAAVGFGPLGSTLALSDSSGEPRMLLGASDDETYLEMSDKQGFKTAIGSTDLVTPLSGEKHKTSAASIVLFGKDRNVLWSEP